MPDSHLKKPKNALKLPICGEFLTDMSKTVKKNTWSWVSKKILAEFKLTKYLILHDKKKIKTLLFGKNGMAIWADDRSKEDQFWHTNSR